MGTRRGKEIKQKVAQSIRKGMKKCNEGTYGMQCLYIEEYVKEIGI